MKSLHDSSRLKMKRDTFFLPDSTGNVYFRNNVSSFHMKGQSISQWIEKLTPMLNGEFTLGALTDGLPEPYKERVFEIASILYENGFAKDISEDRPHQLQEHVCQKYASQIEFLNNCGDSGAYRFQQYRQSKVLAVGSGTFFLSLVSTLLESGVSKLYTMITNVEGTNTDRLQELIQHGRESDSEVFVQEIPFTREKHSFLESIQPFDCILYVSTEDEIEELRMFHHICKEENKLFFPALCMNGIGFAGPLVHAENDTCWDSAWRRLHQSVFPSDRKTHDRSSTAEALLANISVFECLKKLTGITKPSETNRFYLLNLETLEGDWHSFLPHPFVKESINIQPLEDFEVEEDRDISNEEILNLHPFTSKESGIFHIWEEGNLKQLPLAQCRIQVTDLRSDGPAYLLPEIVCSGFTHTEVRCEAGLRGIESYVARIIETPQCIGVGAGLTKVQCVYRALQHYLDQELKMRINEKEVLSQIYLEKVEDDRIQFYFEALTTMCEVPFIALGEPLYNFPVVWVCVKDRWYANVGFNTSIAVQRSLEQALAAVQNNTEIEGISPIVSQQEHDPMYITISSYKDVKQKDILQYAIQVLQEQNKKLSLFDVTLGEEWEKYIAGIVTVSLREEEAK
ncbi:putative thiazole-containing bacteriocin maturation protein [Bacillus sp. RG28]|uniref:Thiazole-containing bacteriocin maturation protein n=1 Tax=Gottfriedia endophytica TaxID=2820819 RepID=A0A940SLT7_9BACI|nr:putative thiazole-containing bacteriocin maturation protein [Gottfriedia endophytica]MBP0726648.1 putative thiazole-containing bacteriocin maturation protein [Gottfriedia endophytica]